MQAELAFGLMRDTNHNCTYQSISAPEKTGAPLRLALRATIRSGAPASAPASNPERALRQALRQRSGKKVKLIKVIENKAFNYIYGN